MAHGQDECMRRPLVLTLFAAMAATSGCGSGVVQFDPSQPRFINKTPYPDSAVTTKLEDEISEAADWIGKGYHGVPGAGIPDSHGNIISRPSPELDAKVHRIAANLRGITVETRPDVPASIINALPDCRFCPYPDPSGFMYCPDGSYCEEYSPSPGDIVVPQGHPEYFGPWGIMTTLLHYCDIEMQR